MGKYHVNPALLLPVRHGDLPLVSTCDSLYLGLGLWHLYTMQEIKRAQDLIYSQFEGSITGKYMNPLWKSC